MSCPIDPFDEPPVVMKKVSLAEIIELLRSKITTDLMPSATGERQYMSKPTYIRTTNRETFIRAIETHPFSGTFVHDPIWSQYAVPEAFAGFPVGEYYIAVDLVQLRGYVMRMADDFDLRLWEWPQDRELALDRMLLKEAFDNF